MAWHPWRELRGRSHIRLRLLPLPDDLQALYARRGTRAAILLDSALTRRERNAALTHELIHDERGDGADALFMPAEWATIIERQEHGVEREVARRLVPVDELRSFAASRPGDELGVTLWEIAEEFDVPEPVARRAVHLLRGEA